MIRLLPAVAAALTGSAAAATLPTREAEFLAAFGVCVHLEETATPYANTALVLSELQTIQATHIRVLPPAGNLPAYRTLAAKGAQFDVVMQQGALAFTAAGLAAQIAALQPVAGDVESVEGPNEVDGDPIAFDGQTGPAAAATFQRSLWAAIQADASLSLVAVLPFSLADNFPTPSALSVYGNQAQAADRGNLHAYGSFGVPPFWWMGGTLATSVAPGLPQTITETGNYTLPDGGSGVDPYVQAVWALDTRFDAVLAGVARVYYYELMDPAGDVAGDNPQLHFGLFNADGTPKLAATALHNLAHLMADNATTAAIFTPAAASPAVAGLPAFWGFSALLQKSDGRTDLVLWQEPTLWNAAAETEFPVTPAAVTVTFPAAVPRVAVFDPVTGYAPLEVLHNARSVTVQLGTDPLIVRQVPQRAIDQGVTE